MSAVNSGHNHFEQWLISLQTPEVRALAWSCFGEHWGELIAPHSQAAPRPYQIADFELTAERRTWLEQLDQNPSPLLEHLAQRCRSSRLGLRFESYWHFFLVQDPNTELLAHNLAVHDVTGRTLGELDILYFCHEQEKTVHLELAVKFYLASQMQYQEKQALSQWLGPECRDRLDLKLGRLLQHQLPLIDTPVCQQAIAEAGIQLQGPIISALWLKGRLFHAFEPAQSLHQRWLSLSQMQALPQAAEWRLLEKPDWLSQFPTQLGQVNKAEKTAANISTEELSRPRMFYRLADDKENRRLEHCMLTPDDWPGDV